MSAKDVVYMGADGCFYADYGCSLKVADLDFVPEDHDMICKLGFALDCEGYLCEVCDSPDVEIIVNDKKFFFKGIPFTIDNYKTYHCNTCNHNIADDESVERADAKAIELHCQLKMGDKWHSLAQHHQ